MADGFVKNFHGIIGGSASGFGLVTDEPGVTQAAGIDPVLVEIVFDPAFAGQLADTVYCIRFHDGILRGIIAWCRRAENGDRAGPENSFQLYFAGDLQHVEQASHINIP